MFYNLHTHTHYSRMDGMQTIHKMIERVKELGQDAVGITDHGTVSGHADLYKECKKAGIKPILGLETYLCDEVSIKSKESYHLVLYAMGENGLENLYKLQSAASKEGFYSKPRVDWEMLRKYKGGLIATSACMGGVFKRGPEYMLKLAQMFGGRFYCELHTNRLDGQREYNLALEEFARQNDLPVLVAVDAHYTNKEQADLHRGWTSVGKDNTYYPTDDFYMMSEEDARERLQYLRQETVDQGIYNQSSIVGACMARLPFGEKHYPVFPVQDQMEHLKSICREGWMKKVPKGDVRYKERVLHEFSVLEKADYINYFCIAHDLISWCKQSGIRVGVGRGSVAASLVAYLAGITGIDPVRYDLIFDRFCHLERVTNPDVDIDVSYLRREEVISHLQEKYGTAYQVRTFSTLGEKGAVQKAGQILKYDPAVIDKLSTSMTSLADITDAKLRNYAENLVGLIDKFSVHASAIVLMPSEPYKFFAVERQGDGEETKNVACFYHEDIAEMGVLKQDILGLRTLDILDEAERVIKDVYGTHVDLSDLPDEDALTFKTLQEGKTSGLFQLESYGMTKLCKQVKPTKIDDLVHLVALFRPGPRDCGMVDTYLANRHSKKVEYDHPLLEPILKRTEGIILYQEQIMQICQSICGYTLGEGDVLRRIIGKKKLSEMGPAIEKFITAGVAQGHEEAFMKHLADQIVTFANYGFNIAHSASYGYTAYMTAYVKAHFPLAFWCGRLNAYLGDREDTVTYVAECKQNGIEVLLPDVMKSERHWTVEVESLRTGYAAVKNLGENTVLNCRTTDIYEFIKENKHMNKRVVESMIKAGMFPGDRAELLWYNEAYRKYLADQLHATEQIGYFADKGKQERINFWRARLQSLKKPVYPGGEPYNNAEGESEMLGFSDNDILDQYNQRSCNGSTVLCGEVVAFRTRLDKKKNKMAFVSLRTKRGVRELVVFHRNYKEFKVGKVYVVEIEDTRITDSMEAKKIA